MGRKPVQRDLPALAELCPQFSGFEGHQNKSALVLRELRRIIKQVRPVHTAPFYAMRQVGSFFGLSVKPVAQLYEQLQAEGLLSLVRGSQSLVLGRKLQPRHPIRGVIGVPLYLPAMVIGNDWRDLMIHLEDELRRHQFVCDFIFYRADEQFSADLTQRLVEHQLDTVFWYCPVAANVPTMQILLDGGIRLVVVTDGKGRFPREQYVLNLDRAFGECLTAWQHAGLARVVILHSPEHPSAHAHRLLRQSLDQQPLPWELVTAAATEMPRLIRRLIRRPRTGVIFLSHPWYESLCNQFPRALRQLFCGCRVFLAQGALYHPAFQGQQVPVDTIGVPNEDIARRVARDIANQRTESGVRLFTFHTRWLPRVNLGTITRGF